MSHSTSAVNRNVRYLERYPTNFIEHYFLRHGHYANPRTLAKKYCSLMNSRNGSRNAQYCKFIEVIFANRIRAIQARIDFDSVFPDISPYQPPNLRIICAGPPSLIEALMVATYNTRSPNLFDPDVLAFDIARIMEDETYRIDDFNVVRYIAKYWQAAFRRYGALLKTGKTKW